LAGIEAPDALQVERAVRAIRQRRLPDPAVLPNAGSFFKNPVVTPEKYAQLAASWPDIPRFSAPDGVKVPAAWLVERCGWKGRRIGSVGVHAQQALVLIHYPDGAGGADGRALLRLAAAIQADVAARFGIDLEREPTVYGDD
jgi:UDP-N-acetylmuramate dehydrogenase